MLAQPVAQALVERSEYKGGYAFGVTGSNCPKDIPVACGNGACCPSGQTCFGYNVAKYCCPTGELPSLPSLSSPWPFQSRNRA